MTDSDAAEINRKLDLIIDAFGLGKLTRMSPVQRKVEAEAKVLQFLEKRRKKHEHDDKEGSGRRL